MHRSSAPPRDVQRHRWPVRITHWLMALAILAMIGSGWRIYNASPIFPFRFPDGVTLGGDGEAALAWHNDPGVASAIAWHFAAMWVLAGSYFLFLLWGTLSGHFWHDFLPSDRARSGATSPRRCASGCHTGWGTTTRCRRSSTGARCWRLPS